MLLLPLVSLLPFASLHATAATRSPLARAGDLDGDGVPDLWVTYLPHLHGEGGSDAPGLRMRVLALSGRDGAVLLDLESDEEDPRAAWGFGRALAPAGDVDGDGVGDLLVATGNAPSRNEAVELRSGRDGRPMLRIEPERDGELFGSCLAGERDFDSDGVPDVLVAAPGEAAAWQNGRGTPLAYCYSGRTGEPLPILRGEDGERTHRIPGPALSVAALPDVDGDRWPDFAVGGWVRSGWDGHLVFRMEPGDWAVGVLGDVDGDGLTDLFLSDVDREVCLRSGRDGSAIRRWSYVGGSMHAEGSTVSAVGDADGDGVPDLAIGANEHGIDRDPGWARLVSGATGATLWSRETRGPSGYDVEGVGDVDGDGRGDVALRRFSTQVVELVSGRTGVTLWSVSLLEVGKVP